MTDTPSASSRQSTAAQLAQCFRQACLDELSALKPGNVHIFADGHGMVVDDFIRSADAASAVIAAPDMTVGQRIQAAITATWQAVGCNTNLGIVLLAGPLLQAAWQTSPSSLQQRLQAVLAGLTIADAQLGFAAIQQAAPAGLGKAEVHDVNQQASVTLLEAMQAAQQRDLIARQYANGYTDIFDFALPLYQHALLQWQRPAWAVTAVYLGLLAEYPDSHIVRKYGTAIAQQVSGEARHHLQQLQASDQPKSYQRSLMGWDADLKSRGINPGTSADLTVITLLVAALQQQGSS